MKPIFAIMNLILSSCVCYYLYNRLVKPILNSNSNHFGINQFVLKHLNFLTKISKWPFYILSVSSTFYFIFSYFNLIFLVFICSILMAILLISFFVLLSYEISYFFLKQTTLLKDPSYKKFWDPFLKIIFIILVPLSLTVGFYNGHKFPKVEERNIEINSLPFSHLKIVFVSDLHLGPYLRENFLQNCVDKINTLGADIIILGGDIIDQDPLGNNDMKEILRPLKSLKSVYGTFLILGNHEYYNNVPNFLKVLPDYAVKPIINETVTIGVGVQRINLVGLSDPQGENYKLYPPSLENALKNSDDQVPTILLTHQPKQIELLKDQAFEKRRVDLILSGHTHGGQFFPFHFFVNLKQPFISGLHTFRYNRGETARYANIYVSNGAGLWGPPIRLFADSEITLLTLTPSKFNLY